MLRRVDAWWVAVGIVVFFSVSSAFPQDIVINEVMASNGETIADEDGEFSDWIELYNAGQNAVDLAGWGISDDPDRPFRWVFPAVTVNPGKHLMVWASGKNRFYGTVTEEKLFVSPGVEWRYLDNGSDHGTAWRSPAFNDTAWASGPAPLGYGPLENYVVTTVGYGGDASWKHITTYFRKQIEIDRKSVV